MDFVVIQDFLLSISAILNEFLCIKMRRI